MGQLSIKGNPYVRRVSKHEINFENLISETPITVVRKV